MLLLVTMDLALGNYSPRLSESGGGGFVAGGRSEEYRANEAAGLVAAGGNQEAGKRDVVFKDCAENETRNGLRLTQIFEIFFFLFADRAVLEGQLARRHEGGADGADPERRSEAGRGHRSALQAQVRKYAAMEGEVTLQG